VGRIKLDYKLLLLKGGVYMILKTNVQAVGIAQKLITDWNKEHAIGIYLRASGGLIRAEVLTMGTLTGSVLTPRDVFKPALIYNAASVILLHNHPSGDLMPSDGDKATTKQIRQAAKIMMIMFQDHVIFGMGNEYYSFNDRRLWTFDK
jgi:DNA repair protein RadC